MEGRSPEFVPIEKEATDDGFSEKRAARLVEGVQKDNSQVKKRKPSGATNSRLIRFPSSRKSPTLSIKDKILGAYKMNSAAIVRLVESLALLNGINTRQEEQLVSDIKMRRHLQEDLLNALILEQKGQLTEDAISKEAWNLIQ